MSNNCLTTKLKTYVDNTNLPYLGKKTLKFFSYGDDMTKRIFYDTKDRNGYLEIISNDPDAYFRDKNGNNLGKRINHATYSEYVYVNKSCDIIFDYYDLCYIATDRHNILIESSLDFLKYSKDYTSRNGLKAAFRDGGDIINLTHNIQYEDVFIDGYYNTENSRVKIDADVIGDIECLKNMNFRRFDLYRPINADSERPAVETNFVSVYGNGVETFKNMQDISAVYVRSQNITGSVEDLAAYQSLNGRVDGSISIDLGKKFTFNNGYNGYKLIEFNEDGCTVNMGGPVLGTYDRNTNTWTYA